MKLDDIRNFLDGKVLLYNRPEFIETDPIQIPKSFTRKENIEISGFLSSIIAWGNRISILKNARYLMQLMDNDPYEFTTKASEKELFTLSKFVHRTINGEDMLFFITSLKNIYLHCGGLENVFTDGYSNGNDVRTALIHFHEVFFGIPYPGRSRRHIPDVASGSAAKRLNLFLRWMVRNDNRGVDLGLWKHIPPSVLMLPLDVHSGKVARELGLLQRRQNDWKAVEEVTSMLREFDPADPVRYDFALFGLGVFEKF
jgi:uncharacterized protein (TIGR02757 family)